MKRSCFNRGYKGLSKDAAEADMKHDLDINIPCYLLDISSNNKIYYNSDNNLKCINSPEDLIYIIYNV